MTAGETRRLWIPANLAYGERPPPGAPAGQLCFDVTLYSFKSSPKPPSVPADVAAVPADAVVTSSGLASRMLKAGSGGAKPKATDRVTVNYSGWTTNGKLFDSSIPTYVRPMGLRLAFSFRRLYSLLPGGRSLQQGRARHLPTQPGHQGLVREYPRPPWIPAAAD